ncbi:hypothetical protein ACFV3R_09725 [Streptomyces sp. NPDC059740]|uniref:hypothetical protein n=1 Tax=Streptomyces sp. NPDC059740 TaxID=3346926 RepID=UPI00365690FE
MSDTPFTRVRSRTRRARRASAGHVPTAAEHGHHRVGADEKLIRRMLAKVGARPVGYAEPLADDIRPADPGPGAPQSTVTAAPGRPPADERPSDRQPAASTASQLGAARLPDWRLPDKPELTIPDEADEPAEPEHEQEREPEDDVVQEDPVAGRPRLRDRVRTWVGNAANDAGEAGAGETPGDEAPEPGEESEENGDEPAAPSRRRRAEALKKTAQQRHRPWRAGRPPFAAPGIAQIIRPAPDRRSLIEAIRSTPPQVTWLLYSGSALGVGFWRGWPQWVRDGVAFLVREHPTLNDFYSWTCYGIAAGVLLLDYRARKWIWPLAWAARIPSACLVAGVAMYGDPTPISQMTF